MNAALGACTKALEEHVGSGAPARKGSAVFRPLAQTDTMLSGAPRGVWEMAWETGGQGGAGGGQGGKGEVLFGTVLGPTR